MKATYKISLPIIPMETAFAGCQWADDSHCPLHLPRGKLLSKLSNAEVKVYGGLRCDGMGHGWALLADIPKHQVLSFC